MIQDIEPSVFNNTYTPDFPAAEDILFYFEGSRGSRRVAVRRGDTGISCPLVLPHTPDGTELRYLFSIDSTKYFLALSLQGGCPSGFSMERTSIFRICAPRDLCFAGMTACHLYEWYSGNRFCGRCGTVLKHSQKERALCCPSCGNVLYPVIAPAVIIGVTRGDSILMTRYANREYKGRALLAGFCEIGETVEQTVMREAMEEVGLHIKNIRYFGSFAGRVCINMADTYTDTGDALVLLFQEAILTLPTMQRTVFNLRYYDELPYEDIAAVTGSSVGAAKTNYHLAKEKISNYILAHQ